MSDMAQRLRRSRRISSWALIDTDGSWSAAPEDCDLIVPGWGCVYLGVCRGDVPTPDAHVGRIRKMLAQMGLFYDAMRAKRAMLTHSPGANAPEVAEFAFSFYPVVSQAASVTFEISNERMSGSCSIWTV